MPSALEIVLYILIGAGAAIYIGHTIYRTFKPKKKTENENLEDIEKEKESE